MKCSFETSVQHFWYGPFEDVGAQAPPDGFPLDFDTGFAPPNPKLLFGFGNFDFPTDVDTTAIHGKCAVLDSVCRKLVKCHRKSFGLVCRNIELGPALSQVLALYGPMCR